ncbi:MAG: GatB/YqeY domain-containing protein [Marinilabiliaceae bacterium]|nr:GatB/YqeY domain-containing protein [Marinilabiliaceae bacterium]
MSLFDQISNDIKEAMKARETIRLEALRGVKKEFIEAKTAKGGGGDLDDADAVKIIQKLVKQRRDSADLYKSQNRSDLADKELQEADVLIGYLPAQMTEDEIVAAVKNIINEVGASGMKDMGKVMGVASKELTGKADGKLIANIVKKMLS